MLIQIFVYHADLQDLRICRHDIKWRGRAYASLLPHSCVFPTPVCSLEKCSFCVNVAVTLRKPIKISGKN